MKIICKTTLLSAEPPFVGTRIGLRLTDTLTWGIYAATLAEGSAAVEIDWGDGTRQTCETVSELTHTYPAPGEYEVRISDDIAELGCAFINTDFFDVYAPLILSAKSNATKLASAAAYCFGNAVNLSEVDLPIKSIELAAFFNCFALIEPRFPNTTYITTGIAPKRPFKGCANLQFFHFGETNEEAITNLTLYKTDPTLGSGNGVCKFDL